MGVNTLELVKDFLGQRLEVPREKVVSEALLADLGVDSLMFAEMLFEFEDRAHVSIDAASANTIPATVGELVALIDACLATAPATAPGGRGNTAGAP